MEGMLVRCMHPGAMHGAHHPSPLQANKGLTDEKEIHQKVADAHEATAFIRESIVQARKTSSGSYGACQECEAAHVHILDFGICKGSGGHVGERV